MLDIWYPRTHSSSPFHSFSKCATTARSLDLLNLLACAEVGTLLPLVVGVDVDDSLLVLQSLLGSASLSLLCALSLVDLGSLVSHLTSASH